MNVDVRLVTNYPKWKTRSWGLPNKSVRSLFWHYVLTRMIWEAGGESLDVPFARLHSRAFSRAAARLAEPADVVHAWASSAWDTLRQRIPLGLPTVLDRGSAHRIRQDEILLAEHKALGLSWPRRHPSMVRREIEEYETASRITVPSRFVFRSFTERGIPPARLHLNGYGVDFSQFQPGSTFSPETKPLRLIYAGSLSVRKGIHHLCQGFKAASLSGAELRLVGGRTKETDTLLGKAPQGIRHIHHLPQLQLVEEYQKASLFVMPSLEEGQAMVQLQALACGLPLVCTTRTGGEDLLCLGGKGEPREGGVMEFPAGFVIPPGQPEVLARVLRQLDANRPLLAKKKQAALALRENDFSWRAYAKRALALYESLLSQ